MNNPQSIWILILFTVAGASGRWIPIVPFERFRQLENCQAVAVAVEHMARKEKTEVKAKCIELVWER